MVSMPRNPNNDFKEQLKNYLKAEWMKNGQKEFSKTLVEITIDLFGEHTSARGNKVFQYVERLENSCTIAVRRGNGKGKPNWYTWLNNNASEQIAEKREKRIGILDDFQTETSNVFTNVIQKYANIFADQSKEYIAAIGELEHYKQILNNLKYFSVAPDGQEIFIIQKESGMKALLEQLKLEQQQKQQQEQNQKEEDNTIDQ
jgi:hypothetical protein